MARNPFKRQSRADQARRQAEAAVDSIRDTALGVRSQADSLLEQLAARAEPVPEKGRRPVVVAAGLGALAAIAVGLRKTLGSSPSDDLPSPDVTPTAPLGPTDAALNDPALKAKVESELFRDSEVDKSLVSVDVADGRVTLRGTLESADQGNALAAAAATIDGVRGVDNQLTAGAGNGSDPAKDKTTDARGKGSSKKKGS